MPTAVGRTFKSGNSEAVRLPRDLGFGVGVEVTLVKTGDVLTIKPTVSKFQAMLDDLAKLPKIVPADVRDPDIFPDRDGL